MESYQEHVKKSCGLFLILTLEILDFKLDTFQQISQEINHLNSLEFKLTWAFGQIEVK